MKYIIVTTNYNGLAEGMFADIIGLDDVKIIKPYSKEPIGLLRKAFSFCARNPRASHVLFPLVRFQERAYQLNSVLNKDDINCVIFSDMTLYSFSEDYLRRLKRMPNVNIFVLFLNSTKVINLSRLVRKLTLFDRHDVFTFEQRDAIEHGWCYVDAFYSMPKINFQVQEKSGVFYIGQSGNRIDIIHSVFSRLANGGIYADFNIVGCPEEKKLIRQGLNYIAGMDYFVTVERMCALDCILEVQSLGQVAPTLRYHQAISMNKKLLTNNLHVKELPFYNPDYIKVFSCPEDIDLDWLREPIAIDYGYDGRYSPIHFLTQLKEMVEEK